MHIVPNEYLRTVEAAINWPDSEYLQKQRYTKSQPRSDTFVRGILSFT